MVNGIADAVQGSRLAGRKPHMVIFFWHTVANKFLTVLSNLVINLSLTDMETCYKLFNLYGYNSPPLGAIDASNKVVDTPLLAAG